MKRLIKKLFCLHNFKYVEVWECDKTDDNGITDLIPHNYFICKKCGMRVKNKLIFIWWFRIFFIPLYPDKITNN